MYIFLLLSFLDLAHGDITLKSQGGTTYVLSGFNTTRPNVIAHMSLKDITLGEELEAKGLALFLKVPDTTDVIVFPTKESRPGFEALFEKEYTFPGKPGQIFYISHAFLLYFNYQKWNPETCL